MNNDSFHFYIKGFFFNVPPISFLLTTIVVRVLCVEKH